MTSHTERSCLYRFIRHLVRLLTAVVGWYGFDADRRLPWMLLDDFKSSYIAKRSNKPHLLSPIAPPVKYMLVCLDDDYYFYYHHRITRGRRKIVGSVYDHDHRNYHGL